MRILFFIGRRVIKSYSVRELETGGTDGTHVVIRDKKIIFSGKLNIDRHMDGWMILKWTLKFDSG
jgi:hypothetical protein